MASKETMPKLVYTAWSPSRWTKSRKKSPIPKLQTYQQPQLTGKKEMHRNLFSIAFSNITSTVLSPNPMELTYPVQNSFSSLTSTLFWWHNQFKTHSVLSLPHFFLVPQDIATKIGRYINGKKRMLYMNQWHIYFKGVTIIYYYFKNLIILFLVWALGG